MKVLTATICLLINLHMTRAVAKFHLNKNTRFILKSINPKLRKLGMEVDKTRNIIVECWAKDNYRYRSPNIQISTFVTPQNTNKATPQSTLEVNRQIVQSFISHISKFKRQFSAFSATRDIAPHLQKIKVIAGDVISFIQEIQRVLKSRNTTTAVIRPTKSAAINETSSSRSVVAIAQTFAAAEPSRAPVTTLQLDGIALQASALLEDMQSKLNDMQVDFMNLVRRLCP